MAFKRSGSRKLVYKKKLSKLTASKKKRVGKIRKSAFRAVSGIDQEINDGVFSKVQYQVEELDLNNEYNSSTSTFTPKQRGIYSLLASVSFTTITLTPVRMDLEIRVNGVPRISEEENFEPRTGKIDASGLIQLMARDRVEVFARATGENGTILSGFATRFEGARIN
ncbi:ABC transporter permease [Paenibacillus sp. MDMC362]|uniref:ABC transporter permease n=1 Tax=Paenibacillus sp. MDMC362 TaxID=2977365 RepID=UPI000DC38D86|nr:ABC transporter permease [Paenibacillus sp. MDMC362]RAR41204.1 ABC transporter permease [Paenibacillus sp. MDMC362]